MRNQNFTWSDIDAQITNSPEFQFGMRDIRRIRREIGELIDKLSLVYEGRPESPPDNDEFRVTAGVLTLFGDDESNTGQKQQQMNEDDMIVEDFFSAFEDHGGKQATIKSPVSTRPKNSPRRKNKPRQREERPKLDIFSSDVHNPLKKKKQSGKAQLVSRVLARNSKKLHLREPKLNATQAKEVIRAKKVDTRVRTHPASKEGVGEVLASSVGISSSQVSEYVNGEINDDEGKAFCSQEGLLLAERFVLSLEIEEEE